jgi:gephyrin
MGETDLVKPTLLALGATVHFGRVQMKPGKPMTFATVPPQTPGERSRLVFCLPGNPVSSAVCFALFVQPALRRLAGARHPDPPVVPVEVRRCRRLGWGCAPRTVLTHTTQCLEPWSLDVRPEYVRVHVRVRHPGSLTALVAPTPAAEGARPLLVASRTGGQLSSRLMSMHSANALLVLPGRTDAQPVVAAGDVVPAVLIGALDGHD